jgi:SAM-dependent methyltransferase
VPPVPPDVRSVAACPVCRAELDWGDAEIACRGCGATYGYAGGIPVLRPPSTDAPALEDRWYTGARRMLPPVVARTVGPHLHLLRPPLTYKTRESYAVATDFARSFPADAVVANVGAGATEFGPNTLNLEIEPGPGIDVVGVAEHLPLADGSCAGVLLLAVLEHVRDEDRTISEARRVLRPGGRILVDVPFIQGYHASPADYRRYTEQGLRDELERHGFAVERSGVAVGPASAMAWIASEFLALLLSGRSAKGYRIAKLATTWLALPVKYADRWLEGHPMAYTIPSAVWAEGRVPE